MPNTVGSLHRLRTTSPGPAAAWRAYMLATVAVALVVTSCANDNQSTPASVPSSTSATTLPTAPTSAAPTTVPATDELQQALDAMVDLADAQGGLIAVAIGDDAPVVLAAGVTGAGSTVPVTVDGVIPVASVTKSFVAAIMLELASQGVVDLDATIDHYIEWPHGDVITVRNLLDHTGGLQGWGDAAGSEQFDAAVLADLGRNHSLAEVVELARALPPSGPPDGITRYSNLGYLLAGRIAEIVAGRSFAELLAEHITTPLALTTTYYPVGAAPTSGAAPLPGTLDLDGTLLSTADVPQTAYLSLMGPAAGAMSTVDDLVKWARVALRDQRLGDTDLAPMSEIGTGGVGLGVIGVDTRFGDCVFDGCPADADFTVLALNGEVPGSSVRVWFDTVHDVTIVVYVNRDGVSLDAPMLELLRSFTD